jgi:hypothetical protein
MSQQVTTEQMWNDKDPFLLNGPEQRALQPSLAIVMSLYMYE